MTIYKINVHPVDFLKLGPNPSKSVLHGDSGIQKLTVVCHRNIKELKCSFTTLTAPSLFAMDAGICGTIREPTIKQLHRHNLSTSNEASFNLFTSYPVTLTMLQCVMITSQSNLVDKSYLGFIQRRRFCPFVKVLVHISIIAT